MRVNAVASIPESPLAEALALVAERFDLRRILDRSYKLPDVAEYYRQSDRGYKLFHSREGALHIALGGDGHNDTACYARQAELFVEQTDAVAARRVVEFGCGMGYNVARVAGMRPGLQVLGVDLTEAHLKVAGQTCRGLLNASFHRGNYESLPMDDASFDGVLAVETLCQTDSQARAVAEAARLLRPGGRLVVIDCFRRGALEGLDADLAGAARLVEKTTAVNAFAVIDEWFAMADQAGLSRVGFHDHSAETAPNLRRLHSLALRYFKLPRAAHAISRAFPPLLLENAVCGLLMPYTVGWGAHAYCTLVVEKRA